MARLASSPSHLRDYLVDGTNHHIWSIQLQPMAAARHDLNPSLEATPQTLVLGALFWARVPRRKHDQWHVAQGAAHCDFSRDGRRAFWHGLQITGQTLEGLRRAGQTRVSRASGAGL